MQQIPNSILKFGAYFLRLVRNIEFGYFHVGALHHIRFQQTGLKKKKKDETNSFRTRNTRVKTNGFLSNEEAVPAFE